MFFFALALFYCSSYHNLPGSYNTIATILENHGLEMWNSHKITTYRAHGLAGLAGTVVLELGLNILFEIVGTYEELSPERRVFRLVGTY